MGKKDSSSNKKKDDEKNKGNIYDRIFKENAKSIFIPLIRQELGIEIKAYKVLSAKISKTIEREMDFCYLINEDMEDEFILHLEFQSQNDEEMLHRMARYHGLLFGKHKIPIKHVVIYIGTRKLNMEDTLAPSEIFYGFETINIRAMEPDKLLVSQVPEIIIMAFLAAFPKKDIEIMLQDIVQRLKKVCHSEKDLDKYITQLIFFGRLRKLEDITTKIIKSMPIRYDITKDSLYLEGMAKGIEKGMEKGMVKGREENARSQREISKLKAAKKLMFMKLLKLMSIDDLVKEFDVSVAYLQELKKEMED